MEQGVRGRSMSDYGINHIEVDKLVKFCKEARGEDLVLLLRAAVFTNEDIAAELFTCLKLGIGYDVMYKKNWIPMQRKDFQGYRRKTLETVEPTFMPIPTNMAEKAEAINTQQKIKRTNSCQPD